MTKSIYICQITSEDRAQLLTREPLELHTADAAMDKLRVAERILPEGARRRLFSIDLEELMPKPESLPAEVT